LFWRSEKCWANRRTPPQAGTDMRFKNSRSRSNRSRKTLHMNDEDSLLIEELIRSAKSTPPRLKQLRRRVVRSARRAERKRVVRRRAWAALTASAVAILLAHCVNLAITPKADSNAASLSVERENPSSSQGRGAAEWNDVDRFNHERAIQSGII